MPNCLEQEQTSWQCVWKANTATPVQHLAFSPDGTLFATSGENDRLVKIWYENKHCKYSLIFCYFSVYLLLRFNATCNYYFFCSSFYI